MNEYEFVWWHTKGTASVTVYTLFKVQCCKWPHAWPSDLHNINSYTQTIAYFPGQACWKDHICLEIHCSKKPKYTNVLKFNLFVFAYRLFHEAQIHISSCTSLSLNIFYCAVKWITSLQRPVIIKEHKPKQTKRML